MWQLLGKLIGVSFMERAKFGLVIVGNSKTLMTDQLWEKYIINQAQKKKYYTAKTFSEV